MQRGIALRQQWLWLSAILLIAAARLIYLDADPGFMKAVLNNASDAADEGYWSFAARNMVLFRQLITDDYFQAATSPFYTVIATAFYALFGVNMVTTRLPSVLFGILAVGLVYLLLARYDRRAASVGALALAIENNFFTYSRMGHVEVTCGFFVVLAFYLLINRHAFVWAGVAFGLSIASKIIATLFLPVFCLFFALQWMRRALGKRALFRFAIGLAIVGVAFCLFLFRYYDLFVANFSYVQSQGVAFWRDPARTLIDLFTGLYTSYPSIVLLLLLFGVYISHLHVVGLFGPDARAHLARLTDVDIMVLSWVIGYALAMLLCSDMHHRRMNLFTIPLAMVPGLLLLPRNREDTVKEWSRCQWWLFFSPVLLSGAVIGRKAIMAVTDWHTGPALVAAGGLTAMLVGGLIAIGRARGEGVWKKMRWLSGGGWFGIVILSLVFSLMTRILPNLGIQSGPIRIGILLSCLGGLLCFRAVAARRVMASLVIYMIVSVGLDAYDLVTCSFTARDASRRLRAMIPAGAYVVGDGAHALSLNTLYHPLQAYPKYGVNKAFVARVRPPFLFRETAHRDTTARIDPDGRSITEHDLYAIGASKIEPIAQFPLYPLGHSASEVTYTLYRVTY